MDGGLGVPGLSRIRALIFDFDGTLYEGRGFARRLVLARPGDAPLILAERRTRKALTGCDYGSPEAYDAEFFSRMARLAKRPAEDLRRWYFEAYMPRICGILRRHYRPRPGAAELLENLHRRGLPWAVYSDYPLTAERLAALGLAPPPEGRLYGPEHFGAQKPAVRPFLSIAAALGRSPDRTLVVGDRPDTDGAGAAAAGMPAAIIDRPLSWESLRSLLCE